MSSFDPVDFDDFTPAMKHQRMIDEAIRDVMSGILQLRDAARDHMGRAYIVSEIEDLRAAHIQLGRLLDRVSPALIAAE